MGHPFSKLPQVQRSFEIGDPPPFVTVRSTDATLVEEGETRILYVRFGDHTEACTSTKDRRAHFAEVDAEWFRDRLAQFPRIDVPIATPQHPLEVVTGDTCLVLVIEGQRYVVSFLRDIDPVGWLIPGGCPQSLEELLLPDKAAERECREEVIITDREGRLCWHSNSSLMPNVALENALAKWGIKRDGVQLLERHNLPTTGLGTADRLIMRRNDSTFETTVPVFISPEIASVAITLFREVEVPVPLADLRLYDGEMTPKGELIRRAVRLTDQWGNTVAIYTNGINALEAGWHTPRTVDQATPPGFKKAPR